MLVVISGKRNSGKDTLCRLLQESLEDVITTKKYALADYLKDHVSKTYGIDRDDFDNRDTKDFPIFTLPVRVSTPMTKLLHGKLWKEYKTGSELELPGDTKTIDSDGVLHINNMALFHTPRTLLLLEGHIKNAINPSFFTDKLIYKILNEEEAIDCAFVSDLRYKHELETLQRNYKSLYIIRVNRVSEEGKSSDNSETELDSYDKWDDVVFNDGDLEMLKASAIMVAEDIFQMLTE